MRDALRAVKAAVAKSSPLDVLKCVRIQAGDGSATVTAHNMTFGLSARAAYDGPRFACCVDAARLGAALDRLGEPSFRVTDKQMTISAGRSRVTLPVLPYGDFPEFEPGAGERVSIGARIAPLIERVAYAAAVNDVRYQLVGVCLEVTGGLVHAIATDGHRLAVAKSSCTTNTAVEAIVPRETLPALVALDPDEIEIGVEGSHARALLASKGTTSLACKLVDAQYLPWRRVVPEPAHTLCIDRQALADAIELAAPFANEKLHAVRLAVRRDTLTLSTPEEEGARAELGCEADAESEIGFNVLYLRDVVKSLSPDRLAIRFGDAAGAIRIDDGEGYTAVIMPLRA